MLLASVLASVLVVPAACTGGDDQDVSPSTSVGATTTTVATRDEDGTLVLGVFLPATGVGSDLGQPMIAAVERAVQAINDAGGVLGQDVVLENADEGAGTGPDELLGQGVDAIVGPASSLTALSQLRSVTQTGTGVVVCSPSATALALDDFLDNGFLFRTAPSDSLQMAAIARQAQQTGAATVAVGYLDDPYGRGLNDAFVDEIGRSQLRLVAQVPFSGDVEDLSADAADIVAGSPGVIVLLGDADDGGRLIATLDEALAGSPAPPIIVNDTIRQARQTIQSLRPEFRSRLIGVAPLARSTADDALDGFFTAHAADCVNLIALAALDAGSDAPRDIRNNMASVSTEGRACTTFEACAEFLGQGLQIDYDGASGSSVLSSTTGDPARARFESFRFDTDGTEIGSTSFDVP